MADIKVGLEIHGYLQTNEKLFCKCKAVRHAAKQQIKPNTFICPICTGQPGCKPMLPNAEAVKKIIQIALMLKCKINKEKLVWNRKHYNWPDLPKGYQDTMSGSYSIPLASNGKFEKINIKEVHLEEDPASWNPETGCIDYNRSGLPLVEIVTEPEFNSSEQVANWIKQLILTLNYIKAVDKNAGIKADVNISHKATNFKERVEIKNLNSILNIKKAIDFEAQRQEKEKSKRETRKFDEKSGKTIRMRRKEQEADYRFIPDPDLPIIKLNEKLIKEIQNNLPETPQQKLNKLIKQHKIEKKAAKILSKNLEIAEFFEQVAKQISPKFALNWVTVELLRVLNYNKKTLDEVKINPQHFIDLLKLVKNKKITELKAKQILNQFIPKSFPPSNKLKSAKIIKSKKEIEEIVEKVIKQNKKAANDYLQGEKKALNFLIGKVMQNSERRADFKIVRKILLKKLKK